MNILYTTKAKDTKYAAIYLSNIYLFNESFFSTLPIIEAKIKISLRFSTLFINVIRFSQIFVTENKGIEAVAQHNSILPAKSINPRVYGTITMTFTE